MASSEDLHRTRRGYAALDDAYRSGDIHAFAPMLEEFWDSEIVLETAGFLPDSRTVQGRDAVLGVLAAQLEPFEPGSMFFRPAEFIDAGDRVVVPYRFGGKARHTHIEVEFTFVHVVTIRDGKAVHVQVYETKEEALEVLGLSEREGG
jgi:ketosteroid isomerase-like protein